MGKKMIAHVFFNGLFKSRWFSIENIGLVSSPRRVLDIEKLTDFMSR
jgi:hypothetical protein